MPINYLTRLTAQERTASANVHLGAMLAFVAGALNAGGFLAVGQYTSHMTGIVSGAADNLALGHAQLVIAAALSLFSFVAGSATTAWLVNHAKRRSTQEVFVSPLRLEAALVFALGLEWSGLAGQEVLRLTLTTCLLCFTMGLQNALVTKISNAEIRTTHVTGLVTDIGIELGKLAYWNRSRDANLHPVLANRSRLRIHSLLVLCFFVGALVGALAYRHLGMGFSIVLAVPLIVMSVAPALRGRGA